MLSAVTSASFICALLCIQGNRWILATDEWLRVKGCEDVYAFGDCATVDQRKIMVCELSY